MYFGVYLFTCLLVSMSTFSLITALHAHPCFDGASTDGFAKRINGCGKRINALSVSIRESVCRLFGELFTSGVVKEKKLNFGEDDEKNNNSFVGNIDISRLHWR